MAARRACWSVGAVGAVVAVLAAGAWFGAPAARAQAPPGGPILVIENPEDPFGAFYAEILRAEGLNEFAVADVGSVSAQTLAGYDVVVLARMDLSGGQVAMLSDWVAGGGNLIAMRPDPQLAPLLGLSGPGGTLENGYLRVDTSGGPGAGITGDTMQFHDTADRYAPAGAGVVATLYSDAGTATASPAVTLRSVGASGGQAAAFAYDLARSVVQTRQGNPAWVGQERDFSPPIRSDDLFYPSWVDPNKIAIPQADEQQRLLANLVTQMALDRTPLPRFWYLPRGERAAVVMTGDDHAAGGTVGQFAWFASQSRPGCSVADWGCVRSTSYVFPNTPITPADAAAYQAAGFEIGLHLNTGCSDFTPSSIADNRATQLAQFAAAWPGLAAPRTNRTHCIAWSDWASEPKAELAHGVRLDANYYFWPASWINGHPGLFTGSGFPMRFADTDGSLIDVYQATTQLTDEWGASESVALHTRALLDGALGPNGFYGVFTANMHTDEAVHPDARAIVAEAQSRGVPVISAAQLLEWLDGRNGSAFGGVSFGAGLLRFGVGRAAGARGLEGMVPMGGPTGALQGLSRDGQPVGTTQRVVKGIAYAVFDATSGDYVAQYPAPAGGAPAPPARAAAPAGPRVSVRLASKRVSRRGTITVRVGCPRRERRCRVSLVLKLGRRTAARAKVTVRGGRTVKVTLKLNRSARRLLVRRGRLKVALVVTATGVTGHRSTRTIRLTLRAPRR